MPVQTPLAIGTDAPDFTLADQHGAEHTLSSWRGNKAVLVVFYPFAFSGVCTGELTGFRDRLGEFETDDTTLLTVSCDSIFATRAFADRDALFFPLLSDFWPHGQVASEYGVLDSTRGAPRRSAYVVDKAGQVSWAVHSDWSVARDLGEMADALARASQVT